METMLYICENCGKTGPMDSFRDECRPGWTHGRLIKITLPHVLLKLALAGPPDSTETRLGAGDTAYVMSWCAWRKAEQDARADFNEDEARQRFVRWWNANGYRLLDTSNAR